MLKILPFSVSLISSGVLRSPIPRSLASASSCAYNVFNVLNIYRNLSLMEKLVWLFYSIILTINLYLLSSKSDLSSHDSLPLRYQCTFCAKAVPPTTISFMSFKSRYYPMIPAASTFGSSLVSICCCHWISHHCSVCGILFIWIQRTCWWLQKLWLYAF